MKKKIIAVSFMVIFIGVVIGIVIQGTKPEILPIGSKLPLIT